MKDIEATTWCASKVGYPIIADPGRDIAVAYQMVDPDEKNAEGLAMTCRGAKGFNLPRLSCVNSDAGRFGCALLGYL